MKAARRVSWNLGRARTTWPRSALLLCWLGLAGCADSSAPAGAKGGRCSGNGACNAGLSCVNDRCLDGEQIAQIALKEVQDAHDAAARLGRDHAELVKRIADAEVAVNAAETEAIRVGAQSRLDELRARKLEMERTIAEPPVKEDRRKHAHISKECLDNPLAKGCM